MKSDDDKQPGVNTPAPVSGSIFDSFADPQTAANMTRSRVHMDPSHRENVMIVESDGRKWLFVRADFKGYGAVCDKYNVEKIAPDHHRDHVRSKALEVKRANAQGRPAPFVLMGTIPKSVNVKHGSTFENGDNVARHGLQRHFQPAATDQAYTTLSTKTHAKVSGVDPASYLGARKPRDQREAPVVPSRDDTVDANTFGGAAQQAYMRERCNAAEETGCYFDPAPNTKTFLQRKREESKPTDGLSPAIFRPKG